MEGHLNTVALVSQIKAAPEAKRGFSISNKEVEQWCAARENDVPTEQVEVDTEGETVFHSAWNNGTALPAMDTAAAAASHAAVKKRHAHMSHVAEKTSTVKTMPVRKHFKTS